MKKNSAKAYAILGLLFVLVSIIAFAVPTMKTATFWIAYGFTAAASSRRSSFGKPRLAEKKR